MLQVNNICVIFQFLDKMLSILRYGYKATKPRLQTINTRNLQAYRKELYEARVRAHKEAVKYLNRIQDDFLSNHQKKTAQEHFNNQCKFRTKIARNSYIFHEQLQKNKIKHEQKLQMLEKYMRGEQIKRLNRDRVRKILEYESSNFWLNGQTVTQKFISERVLPEFIGSTQYYHKLHSEAFAYQQLDFGLLHKLSSNQQSVQYKNQILIPLFKQVLYLMKQVKFSDEERAIKQRMQNEIKAKKRYTNTNEQQKLKQQLDKINDQFNTKIANIKQRQTNNIGKRQYFKTKLTDLILLLKKWKQYTDVLGMTSAEVLQIIQESRKESTIAERRKILESDIEKRRDKTFVDAVEEDTEDEQFSLQSFLSKKQESKPTKQVSAQDFNAELASLLQKQKQIFEQIKNELELKQENFLKKQNITISNPEQKFEVVKQTEQNIKIDDAYLKQNETTASIEVLKQQFKNDKVLQNLLDIAGQITVEYPKLFKKIWDNQIL